MKMTPALVVVGALMVFWSSVFVAVILPAQTMSENADPNYWRPWSANEEQGHQLYVANGCSYCHSQFVRTIDFDAGRIAQRGDYVGQNPAILGTERTGPDLSQAGGEHPDDWHLAHFTNPRYTRPRSLMPSWEFLGRGDIDKLTAYVQSQGLRDADYRVRRQKEWRPQAQRAYLAGPAKNIQWLHDNVPAVWQLMANPYPAAPADLARGEKTYQDYCVSCHGPVGDGKGPAAAYLDPPPLNFTTLRGHLVAGKYIGGIFYYQIMNGITGTAMPYFKRELESEKIWDVSNYVAVSFLGYTDAGIARGIPASYEPEWKNTYLPPNAEGLPSTQPATQPAAQGGAK